MSETLASTIVAIRADGLPFADHRVAEAFLLDITRVNELDLGMAADVVRITPRVVGITGHDVAAVSSFRAQLVAEAVANIRALASIFREMRNANRVAS